MGRLTARGQFLCIAGLAALTAAGEVRSLGTLIERTPVLSELDAMGRP